MVSWIVRNCLCQYVLCCCFLTLVLSIFCVWEILLFMWIRLHSYHYSCVILCEHMFNPIDVCRKCAASRGLISFKQLPCPPSQCSKSLGFYMEHLKFVKPLFCFFNRNSNPSFPFSLFCHQRMRWYCILMPNVLLFWFLLESITIS